MEMLGIMLPVGVAVAVDVRVCVDEVLGVKDLVGDAVGVLEIEGVTDEVSLGANDGTTWRAANGTNASSESNSSSE